MRSFLVLHVHVLGVNDVTFFLGLAIAAGLGTCAGSRLRSSASAALWLGRAIHLLGQLVRRRSQALARLVHLLLVVGLERLLRVGHSILHVATLRAGDFVAVLA